MTTGSYSTTQLSVLINNAETFFANLAELNLNGILGECISAAAANAPSCLIFNAANAKQPIMLRCFAICPPYRPFLQ